MRIFAAVFVVVLASIAPAFGQEDARCSQESFKIGGQQVIVRVCAGPTDGKVVPITETFTSGKKSFSRTTIIEVLASEDVGRAADDASLTPLNLAYSLHLELAYGSAQATIEHATLMPGAIALK
jgi:hypothetical protein